MIKKIFVPLIVVLLALTSCKTKENTLNYLQNVDQIASDASVNTATSTIQIGDQFVIMVSARDMAVAKPFNQNYASGETTQSSVASSNTPVQGQSMVSGPTYIVDSNYNIDFPILGELNAQGKNITEFTDELRSKLKKYIVNPSVSVRITNYKVTVLGEVNKPGLYTIPDGQTTLLNALGLAGDLTMYGVRNDILVVRNENGQISKDRINIMDDNFISSPYYQLKQGDVIYVSASQTKEKTSRLDPNTPIYIAVAGIMVTILALVFKK